MRNFTHSVRVKHGKTEYRIFVIKGEEIIAEFWSSSDEETLRKARNIKNNSLSRRDRREIKRMRTVTSPTLARILRVYLETDHPTQKGGTLVPLKDTTSKVRARTVTPRKYIIHCPMAST